MTSEINEIQLIPRNVLFGNPDKVAVSLSPDGKYLTYVAPFEGVLNVWIKTIGEEDDRPLTTDKGRGVWNYGWAYNGEQVIYTQDRDGDENHRLYRVNVATNEHKQLSPEFSELGHPVQAQIVRRLPEFPDELIMGMNNRDARCHDLYLLNLKSGSMDLMQESNPLAAGWLVDNNMVIRGWQRMENDGGASILLRDGAEGDFTEVLHLDPEDMFNSGPAGFTPDNRKLFMVSSKGRNCGALVEFDPSAGTETLLASNQDTDVSGTLFHPTRHTLEAVAFTKDRVEWTVLDEDLKPDFERIWATSPGNVAITSRSLDYKRWIVAYAVDNGPTRYYLYDRDAGKLEYLFPHRKALEGLPLVNMEPISFETRDGLTIHGYLSLPKGFERPGPMVLNVHGGPWHRDTWFMHPEAQWLANRGYACLQVNFRGSTGYGKAHLNAGDREWGGKMQNDLSDAVAWAVKEGIADPEKVAIYGGSYGGYATLAGATFTPELYAAAVSIVGPSNLETFLNTIPPYWESFRKAMDQRVGRIPRYSDGERAGMPKDEVDFTDEDIAEVEFLRSRSPLYNVDKVKVPMLIAQGANDPRVVKAESDQFVEAMRQNGLEVEYVVYSDEGHGFARPQNRLDFYARAEEYLAKMLGGRFEERS